MDLSSTFTLITIMLGSAGIGGLFTAFWNARREARREPLDHKTIEVKHQVDLVGAADQLVNTQASVIEALKAQEASTRQRVVDLEQSFQRVLDELENERQRSEERGHELEKVRAQLAARDERIAELEARVSHLEEQNDHLRTVVVEQTDIDPDDITGMTGYPG